MEIFRRELSLSTGGEGDIINITSEINEAISASGFSAGLACVFVKGSTAAIVSIEHEPGLEADLMEALQRLFPKDMDYKHHRMWGDGNGHSHIRASFLSPSITIPFHKGILDLGTWQQIVLVELDIRQRSRKVIIQIVGQKEG